MRKPNCNYCVVPTLIYLSMGQGPSNFSVNWSSMYIPCMVHLPTYYRKTKTSLWPDDAMWFIFIQVYPMKRATTHLFFKPSFVWVFLIIDYRIVGPLLGYVVNNILLHHSFQIWAWITFPTRNDLKNKLFCGSFHMQRSYFYI